MMWCSIGRPSMRILSLTAGAASMYCGSCLRDNALAAELIRQGHDVTLLPFYTPTLTDEENVSRQEQVFFGGISVYPRAAHAVVPRAAGCSIALVDAPNVIKAFTSGSIAVDPKQLGALTVSTLRGTERPPAQGDRQADRVRRRRCRRRTSSTFPTRC